MDTGNAKETNFSSKLLFFWSIFKKEVATLSKEVINFCVSHKDIILATLIALTSLCYFIVTAYSEVFEDRFPGFRIRIFGLITTAIVLVISFLGLYFTKYPWFKKISYYLQSVLLFFFSYSYFLNIENRNFYPIILTVLPVFIFFIHLTLFTDKWINVYTTLAQILLFVLQTFSLLTFFSVDRVAARSFSQDILATVFNLPDAVWLTICAFAVTLVSLNYFRVKTLKTILYFFGLIFFLVIQILYIADTVAFKNFFYWEKTLIFLIMWDFLLAPLNIIINDLKDDKYNPRLAVSTVYHLILLVIVFTFSLF